MVSSAVLVQSVHSPEMALLNFSSYSSSKQPILYCYMKTHSVIHRNIRQPPAAYKTLEILRILMAVRYQVIEYLCDLFIKLLLMK